LRGRFISLNSQPEILESYFAASNIFAVDLQTSESDRCQYLPIVANRTTARKAGV